MGSEGPSYSTAILGPFRDAWLAGRARIATLMVAGTAGGEVSVEAYHGSVVLNGEVATSTVRADVERAVEQLSGVVGVENRIHVRGTSRIRRRGGDAETKFLVAARLRREPALRTATIHVANVYDGVVTLAGTAPSNAVADAAFDLITGLPGVRRVVSHVALATHADAGQDADAA